MGGTATSQTHRHWKTDWMRFWVERSSKWKEIQKNFSKRVFRKCLKFCRQHHFWWRCATSKKPEQSYESKFAAASGGGTFLWKCQIFNKNLQNFAFRRFNSQLFFPQMVDQLPAFPTLKKRIFGPFFCQTPAARRGGHTSPPSPNPPYSSIPPTPNHLSRCCDEPTMKPMTKNHF